MPRDRVFAHISTYAYYYMHTQAFSVAECVNTRYGARTILMGHKLIYAQLNRRRFWDGRRCAGTHELRNYTVERLCAIQKGNRTVGYICY